MFNLIKYFLCFRNENRVDLYKQCYSLTLRQEQFSGLDLFNHISKTLKKIEDLILVSNLD